MVCARANATKEYRFRRSRLDARQARACHTLLYIVQETSVVLQVQSEPAEVNGGLILQGDAATVEVIFEEEQESRQLGNTILRYP